MEKLVEDLKEIFEIDDLDASLCFSDLDEWDSLAVLSILAILDSDYHISMSKKELDDFSSIAEFIKYVEANAK